MPATIDRETKVPESELVQRINDFKEINEADIVTAFADKDGTFTIEGTVFVLDKATGMPGTPITLVGKMSHFGGPDDTGVAADEGLALYNSPADVASHPELFLDQQPPGTTGLARRLNPDAMYLACRWDYKMTPKDYLRNTKVRVTNPKNKKFMEASPADFGPALATGRIADLSPGLEKALGLKTDDVCQIDISPPATGVATDVNLAEIDKVVFPQDMVRSLVAMTTSNKATYWIVNQAGSIESGQNLMRRAGNNAPEVLLSDTTVFPVQVSDEVPQAVADELNKAIRKETQPAQAKAGPAPKAGDDINAKIFAKAKEKVGLDTSRVPGTDGGNLACAWAVNEMVRLALGKPITTQENGKNGLGTAGVFEALKHHHKQVDTPSPGSIIVSPTPPSGNVHGHIGIVGQNPGGDIDNTQVFSNSSSQAKFAQNRSIKTWKARYSAQLHLPVLYFDINADEL